MFRNSIRASEHGNCLDFEPTLHLGLLELGNNQCDLIDTDETDIEGAASIMNNYNISGFKEEILFYICGVIVRRIDKNIYCNDCSYVLYANESDYRPHTRFTDFKSKGKLIRSSEDVLKIVKYAYMIKQSTVDKNVSTDVLILRVCNHFKGSIFKGHACNDEFSGSHELFLIKCVRKLFYKILCHHIAKEKTVDVTSKPKLGIRQKLTKLILFSNM